MDFKALADKARELARNNPDKVRAGMAKVTATVNEKTGGKYADQIAKGAAAAENALGVPGEAKQAFRDGVADAGDVTTGPVTVDPIDAPEPIDRPEKL